MTRIKVALVSLLAAAGMAFVAAPAHAAATPPPPPPGNPTVSLDKAQPPKGNTSARKGLPAFNGHPAMESTNGKSAKSLTPCGNCYKYSAKGQVLSNDSDGATINFSIHRPFRKTGDSHTLAELAAIDSTGGNVVEVGWNVDQSVNGDNDPHLFVFFWVNGVDQGYNGNGFLDAVGCSPCAGDSLLGAVGTTKQFAIFHTANAWWVLYNGNYVGAYPDALWTGATPPQTFVKAHVIEPFGEINVANDESCTDMGSGAHAGAGASASASSYGLYGSTDAPALVDGALTVPTIWARSTISPTSFRYGGEGFNSIGTDIGVQGSCAPASAGTPAASSLQLWAEFCPDGQTSTGCNNVLGTYTSSTTTLNVCKPLTIPQYSLSVLQNNSGVSGRSYSVWPTSGCTGGTSVVVGNSGSLNPSFEPHGIKRLG